MTELATLLLFGTWSTKIGMDRNLGNGPEHSGVAMQVHGGKEGLTRQWQGLPLNMIEILYQLIRHPEGTIEVHGKLYELRALEGESLISLLKQCVLKLGTGNLDFDRTSTGDGIRVSSTQRRITRSATVTMSHGRSRVCINLLGWMHRFFSTQNYLGAPERARLEQHAAFKYFKKLPIEIQLMVLDYLPLSLAEIHIRLDYPELIPRWIAGLPTRFYEWYDLFCHRDNLRFADCMPFVVSEEDEQEVHIAEIHRSRMADLNPSLRTRKRSKFKEYRNILPVLEVDVASLHEAPVNLPYHLERLYWRLKQAQISRDIDRAGAWDEIIPDWIHQCTRCRGHLPLLISFSSQYPIEQRKPGEPRKAHQFLLIFQTELEAIFREMDVVFRPRVLKNYDDLKSGQFDSGAGDDEVLKLDGMLKARGDEYEVE
ncbi:hypothetical protein DL95DRAFT_406941 [Leptodontidium sp. 2 PMI_412]|nr:hypothetical protein DL95DRAFT_406941 [Leptodontidium sp. 2 PMI_412]